MSFKLHTSDSSTSLRQNIKYWTKKTYLGSDSFIGKLKLAACKIFLELFPHMDLERRHKRKKLTYLIADVLLETVVLLTFMYSEYRSDEYKDTSYNIFSYFPYLRLERLSWLGGVFGIWLIFLILILILPATALCIFTIQLLHKRKSNIQLENVLIYIPLHVINSFIQLSIVSTLIQGAKYGFSSDSSQIKDFKFNVSINSTGLGIGCILFLLLNFTLNYICKLVMTEFRHDLIQLVPYAKAGIRVDIYKSLLVHLIVISYYNLMYNYAWLHYILSFLGSGFMWLYYYFNHPYYNERLNWLFSGQLAALGFVALGHLVGELMGDMQVSLILSIFVTPFVVIIGCACLNWKYAKLREELIEDIFKLNDEDQLELLLRPYLLAKSPEAGSLFNILYKSPVIRENRLLNLLDGYYTFTTQNNNTLARVKLGLQKNSSASFEREYQEFRCRNVLEKDVESETLRFMKFCTLLIETQNYDKSLCYLLKDLWSDLSLQKPNPRLVRSKVVKIQESLSKASAGYTTLIERYPTRYCLYQHYGTLLSCICNDTFKYNEYLQKSEFLKNDFIKSTHLDTLNLFHPNVGILLVSCHPAIFGRIVYVNEEALNILEYNYTNLLGSAFTDLIPDYFKTFHTQYMHKVLNDKEMTHIDIHPGILYYLTSQNLIVPVNCRIRIDAYGNYPCFLVTISRCLNPIHVALIDPNGTILSHSKNFGSYINSKEKYLMQDNIYELVPKLTNNSECVSLYIYEIRVVKNIFHNHEIDLVILYIKSDDLPAFFKTLLYGDRVDLESETKKVFPPIKSRSKNTVRIDESNKIDDDSKMERSKGSNTNEEFDRLYEMNHIASKQTHDFQEKTTISASNSFKSKSTSFEVRNKLFLEHFRQNIKSLKIVIGISFSLFILMNIGISVLISQTIHKSVDLGELENMLNNAKLDMYILWHNARHIDISNRQTFVNIEIDEVKHEIDECIDDFESLLTELKSFSDTYDMQDFYEKVFLKEHISVWNIYNSTQTTEVINFIDFIRSYISHSKNVNQIDSKKMSLLHPDIYYLYQNSLADGDKAFDYSIDQLKSYEQEYVENMRYYLIGCIVGISCVIICSTLFITTRLIKVQRSSNKIWSFIYCISNSKLRELQYNAIDRLSTTHKIDIERDTNFNLLDKKKKLMRINPYRTWIEVTISLVVALVFTGLFYGLIYSLLIGTVMEMIQLRPEILSHSYEFTIEIAKSYSYAKEMIYTGELSIQNATENHILFTDPEKLFQDSVDNFIRSFNTHRRLMEQEGLLNDYIIDLLFSKDIKLQPFLALGLEYSHNTYITDLLDLSKMTLNKENGAIVEAYDLLYENIMEGYLKLSDKVLELLNDRLLEQMHMSIMGVLMYDAFIIVLYFFGVFTGTNKIRKVISSGWSFFNDLHIGDLEFE